MMTVEEMVAENRRRREELSRRELYDPIHGIGGIGDRVEVQPELWTDGREFVPREMTLDRDYPLVATRTDWVRLRCRYDFEYWAVMCVKIKDKQSDRMIPFRLNRPQRRVAALLENDRRYGRPMRMIMLKARQWGGSTLVQIYMAWIQCVLRENWHSLICSQVGAISAAIKGIYSSLLSSYPEGYWEGDAKPGFKPYQGQKLINEIAGRNCRVTLGSSESQNSVRGCDYAMAHLTEVAFWKDTPSSSPTDFIRAIAGAIAREPMTLVVLESTANGVGNFFHTEWLRSERGESDKRAVFVPWCEIAIYSVEVDDPARLIGEMDPYETGLWERGLTLEQIAWYHGKRREYADHASMMAEYPTTPEEAFTNSSRNVFAPEGVDRLRKGCCVAALRGDVVAAGGKVTGPGALSGVTFRESSNGEMKVWQMPREGVGYVVAVDVGGRSANADWSVVAVMTADSECPEVVAQWRGHLDHDLLTWKAAAIARLYNTALLVFESNTLETEAEGESPDQGTYILSTLVEHYPNIYYRVSADGSGAPRAGFHTNRATKQMIITELIAAVRDGGYIERDAEACDELSVYERRANGSYGARSGRHDDILMTRAIGLHVARSPLAADPGDDDLRSYFI